MLTVGALPGSGTLTLLAPVSDGMGDFVIGSGRVLVGETFGKVRVSTSRNTS